jgi:hypothetical protein
MSANSIGGYREKPISKLGPKASRGERSVTFAEKSAGPITPSPLVRMGPIPASLGSVGPKGAGAPMSRGRSAETHELLTGYGLLGLAVALLLYQKSECLALIRMRAPDDAFPLKERIAVTSTNKGAQ